MSKELFEVASRKKFRFESPKGLLTVEDLWDLPLTSTVGKANLDDVARSLHKQLKNTEDSISFVSESTSSNPTVQAAFDLVKYVIGVRVTERDIAKEASARAEKKQQILGLISQKENEQLAGTSLDDLKKMAEAL